MFDRPFSPVAEITKGEFFLDRDPTAFLLLLNYLRDGCQLSVDISSKEMLQRLRADADYFGPVRLVEECETKLEQHQLELAAQTSASVKKATQHEYVSTRDCTPPSKEWKLIKHHAAIATAESAGRLTTQEEQYIFERVIEYKASIDNFTGLVS
jgi:hypothetical protein